MKVLEKGGLASIALLALAGRAVASVDETITTTLLAGSNGNQIAVKVGMAWSQFGSAFTCGVAGNQLTVVNTTGDCTPATTIYTFRVDGGTLAQNHTFKLRIQCSSPIASVEFDGGGFTTLVLGVNTFVVGPDTIKIGYLQPPFSCPAMGPAELVVLVLLLSSAGFWLARSARLSSAAA